MSDTNPPTTDAQDSTNHDSDDVDSAHGGEQRIYEVTSEEVDAEPRGEKCDGCRWETETRYLLAGSKQGAEALVAGETGDGAYNGFCADCLIGVIRGSPHGNGSPEGGLTLINEGQE